jgi:hypothetical protein
MQIRWRNGHIRDLEVLDTIDIQLVVHNTALLPRLHSARPELIVFRGEHVWLSREQTK